MSADATGPLAVFVWKTVADPYVGKISYFRVISGTFRGDTRAYSLPSANEERISQIFVPRGKEQLPVTDLEAGDIGGVAKLSSTGTNSTLCDKVEPAGIAPTGLPRSVVFGVCQPQNQG